MNKALESEEYKDHREQLEDVHQIARDLGMEDSAHEAYDLIKLEVQFTAGWDAGMALAGLAHSWLTKRNPYYLDLALTYCHQHGIPPTPTLWRLLGELAEMRINGEDPPGTSDHILNEKAKGTTLILMANLIYHGDTLDAAASKAANQHSKRYPGLKHYKASYLEKEYTKRWRKTGMEAEHFDNWNRHGIPDEWREQWQKIRDLLPEAGDDLKGNRRG